MEKVKKIMPHAKRSMGIDADQVVITFKHEEFEDELYAVQRYCMIVEEGPSGSFFSINETVV